MKTRIKYSLLLILTFILTLSPCLTFASQHSLSNKTIKIASFNIQVFGKSKANKPDVMKILSKIITKFDIVAIQEIRDKSGTAIKKLESSVDALYS